MSQRTFHSFRDPAGCLCIGERGVYRHINPSAEPDLQAFSKAIPLAPFRDQGKVIPIQVPEDEAVNGLYPFPPFPMGPGRWICHPRVPFISYPEEWTFGMLRQSAQLTLELAEAALESDMELKDATPLNVLFIGANPVFVDVLSFRSFQGRPIWDAYEQCIRTHLLPLWLSRDLGLRFHRIFLSEREGIALSEAYDLLGSIRRLRSPYFSWVTLPTWLGKLAKRPAMPILNPEIVKAISIRRIRHLLKKVRGCSRRTPKSAWTGYGEIRNYGEIAIGEKRQFILDALAKLPPGSWVLDLGANTGEFSIASAQQGFSVVAVDSDEACMDQLHNVALDRNLDILTLVVNIGRPTPGAGWGQVEQFSFLDRCEDRFELVLALALVHHLRFAEGAPLALQVKLMAGFTRRFLLLEWVDPSDAMALALISRFGFTPKDYNQTSLEDALEGLFQIRSKLTLEGGTRCLYLLEKMN